MQKLVPHLWFDKEAQEAAKFYTSIFPDSKIINKTTLKNTPSGDTDIVTFEVNGFTFMAISAGPLFKINPSVSFMVNFDPSQDKDAKSRIEKVWGGLSDGGKVLMPFEKYDFSEKYGWIEDKYGVSWQLMLTNPEGEPRPFIIPSFLFVKNVCGKAEEATDFYISVFKNSKRGSLVRYPAGMGAEKQGTVMFTDFMLERQWFAAMDSAQKHEFGFNEGVSIIVNCENQDEINYFWDKLSAVPEAEQCGWLKDKYGVSWQIVPSTMNEIMAQGTPEQIKRVTAAFLQMKKFDIAELEKAYKG